MPLERTGLPKFAVWSVGAYYLTVLLAVVAGLTGQRLHSQGQAASLALLLSLTLLHSLYWANARMRAPVVPMLAILAVAGMGRLRQSGPIESGSKTSPSGQTSFDELRPNQKR